MMGKIMTKEENRIRCLDYRNRNREKMREYERKRSQTRTARAPERECLLCGCIFKSYRKDQKYCSKSCQAKHANTGRVQPRSAVEANKIARENHPNTGRFETNKHAKHWRITDPHGCNYEFDNLEHFVRNNSELFEGGDVESDPSLAAHQLRRLRPDRKHRINSWKGWAWNFNTANRNINGKRKTQYE